MIKGTQCTGYVLAVLIMHCVVLTNSIKSSSRTLSGSSKSSASSNAATMSGSQSGWGPVIYNKKTVSFNE